MTDLNPGSRLTREYTFGPLYDLLMESFPGHRSRQGVLDVRRLAVDVGRSNEGVYKWLRENEITLDGARRLITLAAGRLTPEKFLPFLFPKS